MDENKKQEQMIIYMEELSQQGLMISDFTGPQGDKKWQDVSEGLRERALENLTIDMK